MHKVNRLVGRPWFSAAALVVAAATSCVSLGPLAYGQGITTGTISGTIVDSSGAAVPGAQITAANSRPGNETRDGTSGANGEFSFLRGADRPIHP